MNIIVSYYSSALRTADSV